MNAALTSKAPADECAATALSSPAIEQAVALAWPEACAVEAVSTTGSTNDDLSARAHAQQPSTCVLRAADFQTGGRGRQQRAWRAARGDAVLFSIAIPIAAVPPTLPAITLTCGVALAECLAAHGIAVRLKWPNDLRVNRCKLGGILTELIADRDGRYTLVIGVGINFRLDETTRNAIDQPAAALDRLTNPAIERSREAWIGALAGAILGAAMQFRRDGFEPFRERFNRLLEMRGELVDVFDGALRPPALSGRVVEVDALGRLVIESDGVRHLISAGDVSIRAEAR